jgi:hypothetical protein
VIRAERIVRGNDEGHAGVDAREFFNNDGILNVAEASAA